MTTECTYCRNTRNLPPGITICHTCLERLETALRDIPGLSRELLTTLAREDVLTRPGQEGGATHAGPAEPVNGAARDPGEDLTAVLRAWADTLEQDHGTSNAVSYSRRILGHLNNIRSRTDSGQLTDEILDAYQRCRMVVDLPPDRVLLGTCRTIDQETGEECPGDVRGIKDRPEARCDTCGTTHHQAERMQAAVSSAWEQAAPLAIIVKALTSAGFKISLSSAKRWARRGDLRTLWATPDGTSLYTMAQVYDTMTTKRANHGGTRHKKERAA
ncbi:hypothetical protein ACFP47_10220 [Nesterenkonia lacusekhoensis]|uniref:Helix-turn-helix DNA binding domain protein n=1 Tax=Nesterenkonia lacusekhoensis TaxID=150832 RepID=A0ABS4T532_9MICC|nr:hypothetical protein [Nesterenkonia lacusekhoensis]MBP2319576.1 hypothetical protein [Nesterenkonia lacusekhoensis]